MVTNTHKNAYHITISFSKVKTAAKRNN